MMTTDTVVVGAGHAGLAVSRLLTDVSRDHVVLDRGRIAERWRSERWDSLTLVTPNWLSRLPGWVYAGPDPDGFMSAAELVTHLARYAASFDAPVQTGTTVLDVAAHGSGYLVRTNAGTWRTRHVVVATGAWGVPRIPSMMHRLSDDILLTTSSHYRNPGSLPDGGVLVVGASSSGTQIADELARAGRDVVLAVGRHTRMPRRYRGMDIYWWMERTGLLSRTVDDFTDPDVARRETSLQLVGRNQTAVLGENLDLATLQAQGVRIAGRLDDVEGHRTFFRDDLDATTSAAERQLHRFLDAIDRNVGDDGLNGEVTSAMRPAPVRLPSRLGAIDLCREGILTVLLATGFEADHSWLPASMTASDGTLRQRRGVTSAPGIYTVGQRFQHRRDSGFIDGARHDAQAIVNHLCSGKMSGVPDRGVRG